MNTKQRVESILAHSQIARNSDTELQIIFLQKLGMNLSEHQKEVFRKAPAMETIRRIRQALQMEGRYKADKEVEDNRYEKFVAQKYNMGLPAGYYFPEE